MKTQITNRAFLHPYAFFPADVTMLYFGPFLLTTVKDLALIGSTASIVYSSHSLFR